MLKVKGTDKSFDMSLLNDEQVERLKIKYQDIAFESVGLIKTEINKSTVTSISYLNSNGEKLFHFPTCRRTAIAQWFDPHTGGEIVFYPQGTVRSYITKRSGMTNQYFDEQGPDVKLSDMMKAVLGQIVTSRTIKSRRLNLGNVEFLTDIAGSKEEFEEMCLDTAEVELLDTWQVRYLPEDEKQVILDEHRRKAELILRS